MRILPAALASTVTLALAATPAFAQDRAYRHEDGIDAGDVFAGLLIVGGIAAIVTAMGKSKRDRQASDDVRYAEDQPRGDSPASAPLGGREDDRATDQSRDYGAVHDEQVSHPPPANARAGYGIGEAIDACVGEIRRGNRTVEMIDGVNREGLGWRVGGRVTGNYGFSCVVDREGRVKTVEGL